MFTRDRRAPNKGTKPSRFKFPKQVILEFDMKGRVLNESEVISIYDSLVVLNRPTAEFFWCMSKTGLRALELIAVSFEGLHEGQTRQIVHPELRSESIPYLGYLVVRHQARIHDLARGLFVPLSFKSKGGIGFQNTRTIPIFDDHTWKFLSTRRAKQVKQYMRQSSGKQIAQYRLFADVDLKESKILLQKVSEELGLNGVSWHSCRPFYRRDTARIVGSEELVLRIMGINRLRI
jgi:hypothetical protein